MRKLHNLPAPFSLLVAGSLAIGIGLTIAMPNKQPSLPPVRHTAATKPITQPTKPVALVTPVAPIAPAITPKPVQAPVKVPVPRPAPVLVAISDTYPAALANLPLDSVVDSYGMSNRECVSYTAAKVQQTFGNMPDWTLRGTGVVPNAGSWIFLAQRDGFATGATPRLHSVAIARGGQAIGNGLVAASPGHAMWVEQVNADGTIRVSQYNRDDDGAFTTDIVSAANLTYIYFGG